MDAPQKTISSLGLFYLSSAKDEEQLGELMRHLSPLRHQGILTDWHPLLALSGRDRAQTLADHLNQAALILLLISADFMDEYDGSKEMQRALERFSHGEALVIPILIRPCLWQIGQLAILSPLPGNGLPISSWNNRDAAFTDIVQSILAILESLPHNHLPESLKKNQQALRLKKSHAGDLRHTLIARVRCSWINEKLPQGPAWLTLNLREQPDLVANPFRHAMQESDRPARFLPSGTRLIDIYDDCEHTDGFLTLGEPGSGKSMLLWELARDLLKRAEGTETEPIPVIFLLSSWAVRQPPLELWLIEQLNVSYNIPLTTARAWIEANSVLPLLDGLDDVPPLQRPSCIDAINAFRGRHSFLPIIVSSRESDYRKLNRQLRLQTAVIIQSLTSKQIASYALHRQRSLDTFSPDLQQLLQQPLMLDILTAVNPITIPASLSSSQTHQHIFEVYVQSMLSRSGSSRQYSVPQIYCWLSWLARQLSEHRQTEFHIERIQLSWLPEHQERQLNNMLILFFKLIMGISLGMVGNATNGLIGGLFGLTIGICFASAELVDGEIEPSENLIWSWRHLRSGFLQAIFSSSALAVCVLLISLSLAIISSFLKPISFNAVFPSLLTAGIILAIGGAILFTLEAGLSSAVIEQRDHMKPNQGIWRSGLHGLIAGVSFGLLASLTLGSLPGNGAGYGIACGCVLGLTFALLRGGIAFVKHMLLRLFLWHQGLAPFNYSRFLQYAVDHILLRTVGGGYIFYHSLLLDYFKNLDPP